MTASIVYGIGIIISFIGIRMLVKKAYSEYRKCESKN